ncbi:hypothetical protein GCM10023223_45870 [Stackebrandtia albiflava]
MPEPVEDTTPHFPDVIYGRWCRRCPPQDGAPVPWPCPVVKSRRMEATAPAPQEEPGRL